jgi:hypothetical protein
LITHANNRTSGAPFANPAGNALASTDSAFRMKRCRSQYRVTYSGEFTASREVSAVLGGLVIKIK